MNEDGVPAPGADAPCVGKQQSKKRTGAERPENSARSPRPGPKGPLPHGGGEGRPGSGGWQGLSGGECGTRRDPLVLGRFPLTGDPANTSPSALPQ